MPAYPVAVFKNGCLKLIHINYRYIVCILFYVQSLFTLFYNVKIDYVKMYDTFGGGVAAATTKRVVSSLVN